MAKGRTKTTAASSVSARIAAGQTRLLAAKERGAIPSPKGSPHATFPVRVDADPNELAPAPIVDRFPYILGQHLDATQLASIFRLATTGYRQQYVDLLRELLEMDGHLLSVVTKRITSVANGRWEFMPAIDDPDDPEFEDAKEVKCLVEKQWSQIPNLTGAIVNLLWGGYYGASALEQMWDVSGKTWTLTRFGFIHSRRIAWPDSQSWDAHIWDQGQVLGWTAPMERPTNTGSFGLKIADWAGKFVLYTPQLTGDYPTREGYGRETAIWALFKRVGARGAVTYLEKYSKGFMDIECRTALVDGDGKDSGHPREATKEDIGIANRIAQTIGLGSGSYAVHPDSIKIVPSSFDSGSSSKLTWPEWIGLCDAQMSKAVLGGTLGTEVGKGGGNRNLGEVQERSEVDLEQFDATSVADAFRWQSVWWIVKLNRPEKIHLLPKVALHIDVEPDAKSLLANAKSMTEIGGPVDLDKLSDDTGVPLVENKSGKPRRSFMSFTLDPSMVDPGLMSDEAKQQAADATAADQALAQAKAQQPPVKAATTPKAKAGGKGGEGTGGATPAAKPAKAALQPKVKMREDAMSFLLSTRSEALGAPDFATRTDADIVRAVYEMLLEDYPPSALDWILAARWCGPFEIPHSEIDYSERKSWRASHEDLSSYVAKLKEALAGGRPRKPGVFVKTPLNPLNLIVDGHHRTLTAEQLGVPAYAYVAEVYVENGPWLRLHGLQKGGSSKEPNGSRITTDPSFVYEEDGVAHDNESQE